MTRLFVSYSRSIKATLSPIIDLLRSAGHEVWWDADIPKMADWWATILTKIEWAEVLIFVVSEKSVQSPYCLAELKYATERNRPILPFVIDDPTRYTIPPEVTPQRNQWLIYSGDPARTLRELGDGIAQIDWTRYEDIRQPRPPEPNTGGRTLAQQFQQAVELANDGHFEEAAKQFRNVASLDPGQWAKRCQQWQQRLARYGEVADLVNAPATFDMALSQWQVYRKSAVYDPAFDPLNIAPKLVTRRRFEPRIVLMLGMGLALVLLIVTVGGLALIGERIRLLNPPATDSPTAVDLSLIINTENTSTAQAVAQTMTPTPNIAASVVALRTLYVAETATQTQIASYIVTSLAQATQGAATTRTDPAGIQQVFVPAACFVMGSNPNKDPQLQSDELPQHQVCLTGDYWIDQFDVTNAAYNAFVAAGGYSNDSYWSDEGLKWKQANNISGPESDCDQFSSADNQPRLCVSYYEAEAYAAWRGGHLPTEAQWEYAARGPKAPLYPWGDTFDGSKANTEEAHLGKTSAVDAYPTGKSWFGAYDMAGNVWQWVADWYDSNYYRNNPKDDPAGPLNGQKRVLRGGAWFFNRDLARSAARGGDDPFDRNNSTGFRIVTIP